MADPYEIPLSADQIETALLRSYNADANPLPGSSNLVLSGGIRSYIDQVVAAEVVARTAAINAALVFSQVFESGEIVVPADNSAITPVAHGLGGVPPLVMAFYRCLVDDNGYTAGDEVQMFPTDDSGSGIRALWADATQIGFHTYISMPRVVKKNANSYFSPDANWAFVIRAWR